MEPLVHGDYPFIMKALVRDRLPSFTEEESKMIKGSYDFIGINYYTACFASNVPIKPNEKPVSVDADSHVEFRGSFLSRSSLFFLLFVLYGEKIIFFFYLCSVKFEWRTHRRIGISTYNYYSYHAKV